MTDSEADVARVFRPARALPTDVVRPTRALVDLESLRHNLHVLKGAAPGVAIWGVVKADAYGHGAKAVARTLERSGVDGLCVALVEEGVELREAGVTAPILVMGGYSGNAYAELVHHRLTVVLQSEDELAALALAVRLSDGAPLPVHLKVDTGMGRLGERAEHWPSLARRLKESPEIALDGLMTHLANADRPRSAGDQAQLDAFEAATQIFKQEGLSPRVRHAENSAAFIAGNTHFDLVRPGIALYGVSPFSPDEPPSSESARSLLRRLRPVMSLHSRIVSLRRINPGDAVGYGSTFRATRPSLIATVPVGYADGLSRALSNRGELLVRGERAPIAGVVSMDMTMIDVTDVHSVALGDEVILLGGRPASDGSQDQARRAHELGAHELAARSGTIPWEVLTNVSRRVPRFYRGA